MRLPPEPVLLAARRWLDVLPTSGGAQRAQALLTTHGRYSDITPTQYASAYSWLRDVGLLETLGSSVPSANRVLSAIFEKAAPAWVRDADKLVRSTEELPSDILTSGRVLGLNDVDVFRQLNSSWAKVDTEARERVGAAGEMALVELLRTAACGQVDHVAQWSDGFGYDIAVTQELAASHLEVKSTNRANRFTAYLSRHEYDVMIRDDEWLLVTVRLSADLKIDGVGSVPREWIFANVPRDCGLSGSWASVKLDVPADIIESGVSRLGVMPNAVLPPW